MSNLDNIKSIDELYERAKEFNNLEICKSCKNIVLQRGSKTPKILFIGEAAGREEDERGIPFCGRAGKLLDSWIKELKLKENEYTITNVVKFRPPNNRVPTEEEIEISKPFLMKQIELLKPKIIVAVGRTSAYALIPNEDFSKGFLNKCGKFYDNIYILPHPAYCLRNPKNYKVPLENLKIFLRK